MLGIVRVVTLSMTWICHAPTAATRRAAFPADEPIEEKGRVDARAMAGQLGGYDRVYAGPEQRIAQTVEALGLMASVHPDLRECDYGRWTGRPLIDLKTEEPIALGAWLSDLQAAPHGGECLADLLQRVGAWLDGQATDGGRVVAVSHASVIRAAIMHAIGATGASFWRIDVGPLSRTRLSHDGRQWKFQAVDAPVVTRRER